MSSSSCHTTRSTSVFDNLTPFYSHSIARSYTVSIVLKTRSNLSAIKEFYSNDVDSMNPSIVARVLYPACV